MRSNIERESEGPAIGVLYLIGQDEEGWYLFYTAAVNNSIMREYFEDRSEKILFHTSGRFFFAVGFEDYGRADRLRRNVAAIILGLNANEIQPDDLEGQFDIFGPLGTFYAPQYIEPPSTFAGTMIAENIEVDWHRRVFEKLKDPLKDPKNEYI